MIFRLVLAYSTIDKASANFGINERNFLGTGRSAQLSVGLSESATNFRAGITEPYFLDRDLSASAAFFNDVTKSSTYTSKAVVLILLYALALRMISIIVLVMKLLRRRVIQNRQQRPLRLGKKGKHCLARLSPTRLVLISEITALTPQTATRPLSQRHLPG